MQRKTIAIEPVLCGDGKKKEKFVFDIWAGNRLDCIKGVEGVSEAHQTTGSSRACRVYIDHRYDPGEVLDAIERAVKAAEEAERGT